MNMREKNGGEAELRRSVLRGLLWWDYRRYRQPLRTGVFTVLVMALLVSLTRGVEFKWFLIGSLAVALSAGLGLGMSEWSKGLEEYSFGLPPTRRDRYYVRFALGLAYLAVLLLIGLAAGPLGWFRALWELASIDVASGPEGPLHLGQLQGLGFYLFSIGLGLAVYAESFAVSINIEHGARLNWVVEFLPFGLGALLLVGADLTAFPEDAGFLTAVGGLVWAVVRLQLGLQRFAIKDVVLDVRADAGSSGTCCAKRRLALILGMLVAMSVAFWVRSAGRQPGQGSWLGGLDP